MSADWADADIRFMRAALEQAHKAAEEGEVPVGAIVAIGSDIIARGRNRPVADHDPCAHAEIIALREAGKRMQNYRLADATIYVTLEPCTMCIGAMLNARLQRLVFGAYDARAGAAGSVLDLGSERRLHHRLEVNGGLLEDDCKEPLQRFFAARRSDSEPRVPES